MLFDKKQTFEEITNVPLFANKRKYGKIKHAFLTSIYIVIMVTGFGSCQSKSQASNETSEQRDERIKKGGCVKCQCNGWLDENNDDKCDRIRNNDNTRKCQHGSVDH